MTPQERAEAHWDCYVGPLQKTMLIQMVETCMAISRFHYVTSHVHGVKHEQQDARETARAAFTPVHGYGDCKDCGDTGCTGRAVKIGCTSWQPVQDPCAKCATGECTEHKEIAAMLAGSCEDRAVDEWVTKSLCKQCNNPDVVCYQGQLKVNGTCKDFQP